MSHCDEPIDNLLQFFCTHCPCQPNATTMRTSAGVIVDPCKIPENYANSISAQRQTDGRRAGLKIRSSQEGVGSSPTFGTKRKTRICWSLTPPRAAVSPPFRMRSGASQPHCRQAPYSPIRGPHGAFDAVIRPATNTMRRLGLISPIKP